MDDIAIDVRALQERVGACRAGGRCTRATAARMPLAVSASLQGMDCAPSRKRLA